MTGLHYALTRTTEFNGPPGTLDRGAVNLRNAPPMQHSLFNTQIEKLKQVCTSSSLEDMETLINQWRNSDTPDPPLGPPGYELYGLEPVFYHAIRESRGHVVNYFLNNGIKLCVLALYEALGGSVSPSVFQVFLDHGWDINDRNKALGVSGLRWSPLCLVLQQGDNIELVKWFLEHGADPNEYVKGGVFGVTNFMWAARCNSFPIVRLLHLHNARPIGSIVSYAISRILDRSDVITYLLDIGASIDATEFEHDARVAGSIFNVGSAINIASCEPYKEEELEVLLKRGARTDIPDFEGRTCLDIARRWGSPRKVELILSYIEQRRVDIGKVS